VSTSNAEPARPESLMFLAITSLAIFHRVKCKRPVTRHIRGVHIGTEESNPQTEPLRLQDRHGQ
jgi:hypothetical protein